GCICRRHHVGRPPPDVQSAAARPLPEYRGRGPRRDARRARLLVAAAPDGPLGEPAQRLSAGRCPPCRLFRGGERDAPACRRPSAQPRSLATAPARHAAILPGGSAEPTRLSSLALPL